MERERGCPYYWALGKTLSGRGVLLKPECQEEANMHTNENGQRRAKTEAERSLIHLRKEKNTARLGCKQHEAGQRGRMFAFHPV